MKVAKVLMGVGAAVGLLSSTVAMAAQPSAPTNGVRQSSSLGHASKQSDESTSGTYIVAGLAAAAVIAGIVVVASDNNNKSDSNG